MAQGAVLKFNEERGFGFIAAEDGGKDVFLHVKALARPEDASLLKPDVLVSYSFTEGPQGRRAKQVRIIRPGGRDLAELISRAAVQFDELSTTMDALIAAAREQGLDV
jgi:cold shock protein